MAHDSDFQITGSIVPTAEDRGEGIDGTLTLSYSARDDKTFIIYTPCTYPTGTSPSEVNRNCLHGWYIEIL